MLSTCYLASALFLDRLLEALAVDGVARLRDAGGVVAGVFSDADEAVAVRVDVVDFDAHLDVMMRGSVVEFADDVVCDVEDSLSEIIFRQ